VSRGNPVRIRVDYEDGSSDVLEGVGCDTAVIHIEDQAVWRYVPANEPSVGDHVRIHGKYSGLGEGQVTEVRPHTPRVSVRCGTGKYEELYFDPDELEVVR
jgi:hypothetical protein